MSLICKDQREEKHSQMLWSEYQSTAHRMHVGIYTVTPQGIIHLGLMSMKMDGLMMSQKQYDEYCTKFQ